MKFDDDLKKYRHDAAISYLGQLLQTRDDIKEQLAKPNKDLGECMNYLMSCARKQRKGQYAVMSDDEALSLAIHYYDEDDIEVEKISGSVSAVPVMNNNEHEKANSEDVEKMVSERVKKELDKIKEEESKNKQDKKEEIEKMVSERVMNELERIREEEKKSKEEKKARRTASKKNESNENTTTIFDFMED